ncbi:hypothetical protein HELRODRAFT_138085, partial [Helobdella robusta]|uniref:K Homology domain-containing protein n=1 Tax=Helobdella robusta TaxID=6412 RepID=T1EIR6_HELRO
VHEYFDIEHCYHSRLIGVKGKCVQKLMSDFGVEIKFADRHSPNPDQVMISGLPQRVAD